MPSRARNPPVARAVGVRLVSDGDGAGEAMPFQVELLSSTVLSSLIVKAKLIDVRRAAAAAAAIGKH